MIQVETSNKMKEKSHANKPISLDVTNKLRKHHDQSTATV